MTLTYTPTEHSKLIAILRGTNNGNRTRIYISEDKDAIPINSNKKIDIREILTDNWFISKKINSNDMMSALYALQTNNMPDNPTINNIVNEAIKHINASQKSEVTYSDGSYISPVSLLLNPPKEPTLRCYVCGASGSGKSTWIKNLVKELKNSGFGYFINNGRYKKVYVFSTLTEDSSLDDIDPIRIKIDDSIIDNPITLDELQNAIVIFDDVETFPNKEYRNAIANLRDQCLSEGRHKGIITLCTNHQITDYHKTKNMLLECELITFFCGGGGLYGIKRLLTHYVGLGQKDIEKVLALPSRWITIYNRYPLTCMYETGVFLLNPTKASK